MKDRKLQALRGLACLMLVLYHVVGSDPERGLRVTDGGLRLAVDGLAAVRMPLFALLAGVLYGWRPQASWPALADKARRLLIPVVTVGTLFALVQSAVPGTNKQVTDWQQYGGAPLLGFSHPFIKAHGRSNAHAITNAIKVAHKALTGDLCGNIQKGLAELEVTRQQEGAQGGQGSEGADPRSGTSGDLS